VKRLLRATPLTEERAVKKGMLAGTTTKQPTDGITSSADALSADLDRLHAATLVYMDNGARVIADKFHLRTQDVIDFLWVRIRGQRT
jgi:hypothetical protein